MKIVDDDIDVNALLPENLSNTLEEDVGDNLPTIAEFVDERPVEVQELENFRTNEKWKVITCESYINNKIMYLLLTLSVAKTFFYVPPFY